MASRASHSGEGGAGETPTHGHRHQEEKHNNITFTYQDRISGGSLFPSSPSTPPSLPVLPDLLLRSWVLGDRRERRGHEFLFMSSRRGSWSRCSCPSVLWCLVSVCVGCMSGAKGGKGVQNTHTDRQGVPLSPTESAIESEEDEAFRRCMCVRVSSLVLANNGVKQYSDFRRRFILSLFSLHTHTESEAGRENSPSLTHQRQRRLPHQE